MAKTKREYIAASIFTSAVAVALGLTALSSEKWIISDAKINNVDLTEKDPLSSVEYGLFTGLYTQNYGGTIYSSLQMTCLISSNVCALMCASDPSEKRKEDLESLYNDKDVSLTCSSSSSSSSRSTKPTNSKLISPRASDSSREFINAGLYISTILFLCLSIFFGLAGFMLSIWNFFDNPIQMCFSIFGIFVCNGIACGAAFLSLILWGSLFGAILSSNVCFYYSITDLVNTDGMASLGYSYWLILITVVFYAGSFILLRVREYLINKEPGVVIHASEKGDIGNSIIF